MVSSERSTSPNVFFPGTLRSRSLASRFGGCRWEFGSGSAGVSIWKLRTSMLDAELEREQMPSAGKALRTILAARASCAPGEHRYNVLRNMVPHHLFYRRSLDEGALECELESQDPRFSHMWNLLRRAH